MYFDQVFSQCSVPIKFTFIYLLTTRHLSLETDKIYPSTRLLLTSLQQNNKIYIVYDIKEPNSKNRPIFFVSTSK